MAKFCTKCGSSLSETGGICLTCNDVPKFSNNGIINKKLLKEEAKNKLNGNLFNLWKPFFVILGFSLMFSFIFYLFLDKESIISLVLEMIFSFISLPLTFGSALYFLKFVRKEEFNISTLFEFYDIRIISIFILSFLVSIFVILWSFLFIIPGIIAAFSYAMYIYVYVDNLANSRMDVIMKSKKLMKGYKMDYFLFKFSFIGWVLLGFITFGIAYIYVLPYIAITDVMYYNELKAIKEI